MNTNDVATILAMLVSTLGDGISKAQPLALEVVQQYQLRGMCNATIFCTLATVGLFFVFWFWRYQTVNMATIESFNERNETECCRNIVCTIALVVSGVAFIIGVDSIMDYIAPLPQIMRLR